MDWHGDGRLRLGKIDYLNVWPVYYAMEHGHTPNPCHITARPPSELNAMMCRGDLDLSAVSSVIYARYPDLFKILPGLAIACDGPVHSVLLLSQKPLEFLAGEDILLTRHSDTSVVLLKILVEKYWALKRVRYHRGALSPALANGSSPAAFLAIGDEALMWSRHARYPYRYDLAAVWHGWTGLPFVFAVWVVRRDVAARAPALVQEVTRCLWESKSWGLRHVDVLCREAARLGILDPIALRRYYDTFTFDLHERALKGLQFFYGLMADMGDIPACPSLDFWTQDDSQGVAVHGAQGGEGDGKKWAARL
ncbi:menaquinone biosynthetic enzyme MqnA/MqnD family protein [Desulfosoma caldarium]|uniref:Chorismate dehydratase n=1 Tax=Desulfosoma caldarium TaxID=610254 RepID=A0A3N1UNT7_9BACT|nr:menaquinone biosynthesis protein [Desulfosoma caldarium]ROQ91059.1 chorismate dehydratase [Desulfosoma caldarium]